MVGALIGVFSVAVNLDSVWLMWLSLLNFVKNLFFFSLLLLLLSKLEKLSLIKFCFEFINIIIIIISFLYIVLCFFIFLPQAFMPRGI